ncbi:MAG: TatD family hydrolase [Candidatus Methanoperedens sp.]|nr:TatD family hydrolase [Candidatus Methanoperedens sp.]
MTTFPILDNHMHLNPAGRCLDAVREFAHAGGTHLVLVSLPPWSLGININAPDDYRRVFDKVLNIAKRAQEAEKVTVFVILGVHPAELTKYYGRLGIERSIEIMKGGLEIAREYVVGGKAIGLKSGRPHYEVEPRIWDASNDIMRFGFEQARDAGCAIQLHTESATEEGISQIAGIARSVGLAPEKVIKHFSPPLVNLCEKHGIFPSVLASEKAIEAALSEGTRFMMETDYIDDLDRPGSVLGPKTIPRRTKQIVEKCGEDVFWKIHKENPEKVYGIEINI